MTKILFIRHGQTDWNAAGRWQGHADVPLNETGRQQARALAQRLASWPLEAIVTSDLQRCQETARLLAAPHGLEPVPDPRWRERDVGEFSGMTSQETRASHPELWEGAVHGMVDPPNGETFADLRVRAMEAFTAVSQQYARQTIAVVTHGGVLHTLLAQILGVSEETYGRFTLRGNTGLSIVEIGKRGPIVSRLNDTTHLEIRV